MKKMKFCITVLSAIAVMGLTVPTCVSATQVPGQEDKEKAGQLQPVHGKVKAVDSEKKTITVGDGEKTIHVTDNTLITRKGEKIELSALQVGEEMHAMTRKTVDGKTEAVTIRVGPQKPKE